MPGHLQHKQRSVPATQSLSLPMVREVWCFWKVSRPEWLELKIRELTPSTLGFHVSPFYCFLKKSESSGLAAAGCRSKVQTKALLGTCCFQNCLGGRESPTQKASVRFLCIAEKA